MREEILLPGEAARQLHAVGIEVLKENVGNGEEIRCRCPKHPDSNGHLYVNAVTGTAFCHRCQLCTSLAELCGQPVQQASPAEALRFDILAASASHYHAHLIAQPRTALAEQAWQYVTETRCIPPEIVTRFRIGWADGGLREHLLNEKRFPLEACLAAGVLKQEADGRVRDFFYHRLIFPNLVGGQVVHLSGRRLDEKKPKWLHLPGEITHPFNADALRKPGCLWVEGILDVLSAEAWGYRAAAGLGIHFKDTWVAYTPGDHRINVCLDGDQAGQDGALVVARALGRRSRIVSLPEGKDLNDLLQEGCRAAFETCLEQAQDALTFEINRIPANAAKTELPDLLKGALQELAARNPASAEAYLDLLKARFKLKREEVAAYRKMVKEIHPVSNRKADQPDSSERTYTAVFDGLVDLVQHEGEPAFLVSEDGKLRILTTVEQDGRRLVPPPREQIPWLLPRGAEVLRWVNEDSDSQLYDDLVAYHRAVSELPSEACYEFIAIWDLHTYLLEGMHYSPELCFLAVPERGKTRTGEAIIHVAYRGIHVESLREAYILRFAANLGGTIFFDVMNLWRKAEREGSEDIILGRFERGFTVPRVLFPERGPHQDTAYYSIFGPTVIATNEAVHHILDTRAVTIAMPEARRRFEAEVTPESARPFRERLVAFRARHLGGELPEVRKPTTGRLGDILKPLRQIVRLVRPDREEAFLAFVADLQRERLQEKAETLESELLRSLDGLREQVQEGVLPVRLVTQALNEGRPDKDRVSDQRVGRRLRSLGFQKGQRKEAGATILWDEEKLLRAMEAYGLTEIADSADSTAATPESDASPVETVECVELLQGPGADDAHTSHASQEPDLGLAASGPEPRAPCHSCGGTRFWRSIYGDVSCGTCHPPGSEGIVAEWLEPPGPGTTFGENTP